MAAQAGCGVVHYHSAASGATSPGAGPQSREELAHITTEGRLNVEESAEQRFEADMRFVQGQWSSETYRFRIA